MAPPSSLTPARPPAPTDQLFYSDAPRVLAQRKNLDPESFWALNKRNTTAQAYSEFAIAWAAELQQHPRHPSLKRALWVVFRAEFLMGCLLQFFFALSTLVLPVCVPYMLQYVEDQTVPVWEGFVLSAAITVASWIGSVLYYRSQWMAAQLGLRMRAVLMAAVYRKCLSAKRMQTSSVGRVINLYAADSQLIFMGLQLFMPGFVAPLQLIAIICLMIPQVGWFALIPVAILALLLPPISKLGIKIGDFRRQLQKLADKRLKLSTELVQGIRIVKYYAWELPFQGHIKAARDKEVVKIRLLSMTRSFLLFLIYAAPVLSLGATLLLYSQYSSEELTSEKAFTLLTLTNLMKVPYFWVAITYLLYYMNASSVERIQDYLSEPDLKSYVITEPSSEQRPKRAYDITVTDGVFAWDEEGSPTLDCVNIKVKSGENLFVVGQVGAGKSSLIQCLLGEIPKRAGEVKLSSSIAYVPQQAWVFNATIRENIVFGRPYDQTKYQRIVEASALLADFANFPAGDETEIGERGTNLSGGQKQRISIARALYSDTDIYVLDDPFSAVDSHVSKHLFKHVIERYLADKTVVLVTNQLQYIPDADSILYLHGGKVSAQGRFETLLANHKEFRSTMLRFGMFETDEEEEDVPKIVAVSNKKKSSEDEKEEDEAANKKRRKMGNLTQLEMKENGLIHPKIYAYYFSAGGLFLFILMMSSFVLSGAARVIASYWLSEWTADSELGTVNMTHTNDYWVGTYVGWAGAEICLIGLGMLIGLTFWGTNVSKVLHDRFVYRLSRVVQSFFDVTPIGRVMSRLSEDLNLIDFLLQVIFIQTTNNAILLIAALAAIALGSWQIFLCLLILIVVFYFFQSYFRRGNIEIQRREAQTRAPPISHLTSSLDGLDSIRSYGKIQEFEEQCNAKIDTNNIDKITQKYAAAWYGLRLELLASLAIAFVFFGITILRNTDAALDPNLAGIALSFTAGIATLLSFFAFLAAELEVRLNSVERYYEYKRLAIEKPDAPDNYKPPQNWPGKGGLQFKDFSFRYRQGPLVLNGLQFDIAPQSKIGIVGRTGAGKSSLLQALYRMEEPAEGTIMIDGVDFTRLGLYDLRSHLSIIPQDPTMFIGSVRYNLDPFEKYEDKELWDALEMVQLKQHVQDLEGKLQYLVTEGGRNFSIGQRQLVCMARALLRNSPILLLDEATASVDVDTDALIQSTVRNVFKHHTVITIAHRLNTIMDSDAILVLDYGKLVEYDTPAKLLKNPKGYLTSMVNATGPKSAKFLKEIARGKVNLVEDLQNNASSKATARRLKKQLKELKAMAAKKKKSGGKKEADEDLEDSEKPEKTEKVEKTKRKKTKANKHKAKEIQEIDEEKEPEELKEEQPEEEEKEKEDPEKKKKRKSKKKQQQQTD